MSARAFLMVPLALGLAAHPVFAQARPPREVPLFVVTKSENTNRVVYALRLDERCQPAGDAPVRAYWRMLERSPDATEPLLAREERVYGLMRQSVKGDVVRMALHALPQRELTIITWRAGNACSAAAWTTIAGARARLSDVHAVLTWPFGVDHLVLRGVTRDGRSVEEILEP